MITFLIKMKFFKRKKIKEGFTLVETLIAISIFSLSIMAVIFVVSDDIADIGYAKKKVVASYLAKEGVEYIRNLRDAYVLYDPESGQAGWNNFRVKIDPCDTTTNSEKSCYFVDEDLFYDGTMTGISVNACEGSCPVLYKSPDGGYAYNIAGSVDGFRREIKTREISEDEIEITSEVYWNQESGVYSTSFSGVIFNWVE